jgi:hypothetical protein
MTELRNTDRKRYNYLMLQLRKQKDSGATTLDTSDSAIFFALEEARKILQEDLSSLTGLERSRADKDVTLAEWAMKAAAATLPEESPEERPVEPASTQVKQSAMQATQVRSNPDSLTDQLYPVVVTSKQSSYPKRPAIIPPFTRRHFDELFREKMYLMSKEIDPESYALAWEYVSSRRWGKLKDDRILLSGSGICALQDKEFDENGPTEEEEEELARLYWEKCEAYYRRQR